jgi:DNA-binding CsgD family transcriptional regulator
MLIQTEWEQLNKIVEGIYSIKDLTLMRKTFLRELRSVIPFDFSDFELGMTGRLRTPNLVDAVVESSYDKDFEEKFISDYENIYNEVDYVRWIFSNNVSIVYRESDLIDENARKESVFYKEYLKRYGITIIAGISVIIDGKFAGAVTLYRDERKNDFTDKEMYILKQLVTHLEVRLREVVTSGVAVQTYYLLKERYRLTARETEILTCLCKGSSNAEISTSLSITENTAKKHIYNIFYKMEVSSRTSLTHKLMEAGFTGLFE